MVLLPALLLVAAPRTLRYVLANAAKPLALALIKRKCSTNCVQIFCFCYSTVDSDDSFLGGVVNSDFLVQILA